MLYGYMILCTMEIGGTVFQACCVHLSLLCSVKFCNGM